MARIRTLKPEILEDEKTAALSPVAFKLFTGAIVLADDHGNMRGSAAFLRAQIFWANESIKTDNVLEALRELTQTGLITRYDVSGQTYLAITNWAKHQRVDNAGKPRVPGPEEADSPRLAETRREMPLDPDPDPDPERESGPADACGDAPPPLALIPNEPDPCPKPEEIREIWNETMEGRPPPQVQSLNDKRRKKLKARKRPERDRAWWRKYFERIAASDMCCGDNGRQWRATFDFVIESESNVTKVLEGNYDNQRPTQRDREGPPQPKLRRWTPEGNRAA